MAKNDLLKEAIADAKTVRNTALANAKAALEEAFTPKLKSMLSAKLTEELEEEVVDEIEESYLEEDMYEDDAGEEAKPEEDEANEEVMDEEISLEEILAELELEEGGKSEEENPEGTEEELQEMDRPVYSAESAQKSNYSADAVHETEELDEEIDLNALLAELSEDDLSEGGDLQDDEVESLADLKETEYLNEDEADFDSAVKKAGGLKADSTYDVAKLRGYDKAKQAWTDKGGNGKLKIVKTSKGELGVLFNPKPSLLQRIGSAAMSGAGMGRKNPQGGGFTGEGVSSNEDLEEMRDELNEAHRVIKYQKRKLNEVNVLNSKLLYVNKLFKAHNLNENQKIKVVDSLDQAENVKEAKMIYNTLNETFNSVKNQLKESVRTKSFASKATGTITENRTRNIRPVDETVERWKKLANIN